MTTYQPDVHLLGCALASCRGCVAVDRPAQRPASTSDARKRLAETTAAKVAVSRAALLAAGRAYVPKTWVLDEREES